jgi:hypothetical protein
MVPPPAGLMRYFSLSDEPLVRQLIFCPDEDGSERRRGGRRAEQLQWRAAVLLAKIMENQ